MKKSRGTELAKNTFIIAIGRISTQIISFLLLPLYTALLSQSEYGTLELFNTIIQLLLPLATLMIEQGAFRYMITTQNDKEIDEIINSSLVTVIIINYIFVFWGMVVLPFIYSEYSIILVLLLVSSSFMNWSLQITRGLKKTGVYSISNFILAFINIVCNVIFIYGFRYGVKGMLFGSLIGNTVGALIAFFGSKTYTHINLKLISFVTIKKLLKYSIPLIPNSLSLWMINSSDRAIVSLFLGRSANGILAISHKFPSIVTIFFSIFLISWHEIGTVHYKDKDNSLFFSEVINKVAIIFFSMCVCLTAVMPFIFPILVNNKYNEAYMTIPIYLVAVALNVMIGLLGVIYVAEEKTGKIAKSTVISGVINILIHIMFIKNIGLYAAAISTLISYCVILIYRIKDIEKYINIKYKISIYIVLICLFIVACVEYYINNIFVSLVGIILIVMPCIYVNRDILKILYHFIINRLHENKNDAKNY